jgi:molybdopterin molybdotransferase
MLSAGPSSVYPVSPVYRVARLLPVRLHRRRAHVIDGAHSGFLGPAAQADALAVIAPHWHGEPVELLPITG